MGSGLEEAASRCRLKNWHDGLSTAGGQAARLTKQPPDRKRAGPSLTRRSRRRDQSLKSMCLSSKLYSPSAPAVFLMERIASRIFPGSVEPALLIAADRMVTAS